MIDKKIKEYLQNTQMIMLNENIKTAKDKVTFKCECGNIFDRSFVEIKRNDTKKCTNCIKIEQSYLKTKEYIEKQTNIILLTTIIDYKPSEKVSFECSCGETFQKTIKSLKRSPLKLCNKCINKEKNKKISKSLKKEETETKRKEKEILRTKRKEEKEEQREKVLKEILKKNNLEILEPINKKIIEKFKFKCECGNIFERRLHNVIHQNSYTCNNCVTNGKINQDIIKKIGYKFEENNHSILTINNQWYELDLISKKHNIALEYNGLMFHSFGKSKSKKFNNKDIENNYLQDKYKNKDKHLMKTELSEESDIQLFHIFENEWLDEEKKQIWISMISSKIKKNQKKVYGRNTYVKQMTTKKESKIVNDFLQKNHIQGSRVASIKIGLFDKNSNELLSVMTFGKSRYNKNYEYELIRFATLKNHIVVGGASKLLSFFEKQYSPSSLISYGNRRWTYSKNNVYKTLGFTQLTNSQPNFFYFESSKDIKLKSRIDFQKWKLEDLYKKGKLKKYNKELSAVENMYENGYRRIWDSGNLVYVKEFNYEDN